MTKIRHQLYRRMTRKRSLLLKTCEDCDCACMDIQWNSKVAGILVISNFLNDIMIFTIYQLEYNSKKFYSYLWYNIAWIANPNQSIVCHYKCMPYLRIITFNCSIIAIIKAHDFLFCLIYLIPHELWQQHTDMINTAYSNAPKDIFTIS